MRTAKVISAFPGCGKSYYYKEWSQYSPENVWRERNNGEQVFDRYGNPVGDKILDSDSSLFSWIYDENGNKTDVRNPDFPNNYIQYIKDHLHTEDIIFVSSHKIVREALEKEGIKYILIYPEIDMKDVWMDRFKKRGNDDKFIKFQEEHWDEFITDMDNETFPDKITLNWMKIGYEYISVTVIDKIMDYQEEA